MKEKPSEILEQLPPTARLDDLAKLLDEDSDNEEFEKLQWLRELASQQLGGNQETFGHFNIYTKENFIKGVLGAIQETRNKFGVTSAEKLVDFLFIFGYTRTQIIYILFQQGYLNFSRRIVEKYINTHRYRLEQERKKLMSQLDDGIKHVFQRTRAKAMELEEHTMQIYIDAVKRLNLELKQICPVGEAGKFNRISKQIDDLQKKINTSNGIISARINTMELAKQRELMKTKRTIDLGILDDVLRIEEGNQTRDVSGSPQQDNGGVIEIGG